VTARRWAAVALIPLLAACTPQGVLNSLDRASGARGTERAAEAVAFGDHGQTLDIWRPSERGSGLRPVVVFVYGGGWAMGRREEYGFAGRAFASRGYITVVPDYRKPLFEDFMTDGAQAVAWTRANIARYGGDPDRIALAGHSAGAHISALLALDPRWLAAAGAPSGTVKAVVGLAGPYDFLPFTSPRAEVAMGHVANKTTTQPIAYARADAPPMLLATGSADTVVRPRNSVALGKALADLGARAEVREYPGMSHEGIVMALSRPFGSKGPVLDDAAVFLNGVFSGAEPPVAD
jgi:acetyl esterase/lipase